MMERVNIFLEKQLLKERRERPWLGHLFKFFGNLLFLHSQNTFELYGLKKVVPYWIPALPKTVHRYRTALALGGGGDVLELKQWFSCTWWMENHLVLALIFFTTFGLIIIKPFFSAINSGSDCRNHVTGELSAGMKCFYMMILLCVLQRSFEVIEECYKVFSFFLHSLGVSFKNGSSEQWKSLRPIPGEKQRCIGFLCKRVVGLMSAWEHNGVDRISALSNTLVDAETETLTFHGLPQQLINPQPVQPVLTRNKHSFEEPDLYYHHGPFSWWLEWIDCEIYELLGAVRRARFEEKRNQKNAEEHTAIDFGSYVRNVTVG